MATLNDPIIFLSFRVGCNLLYLFSDLWILSIIGSHGVAASVLLPIHAPSILTASLSLAILMFLAIGAFSFLFSFLLAIILSWNSGVPMRTISVLSVLNFAPNAWHHSFRVLWMWSSVIDLTNEDSSSDDEEL